MDVALIAIRFETKVDRCRFLKEDPVNNPVNNKRQFVKVYVISLNVPKINVEFRILYILYSSVLNHHIVLSSYRL